MFSLNQNLDLAGAWFLIVWREERRVESGINGGRSPPLFPPRRPLDFLHCAFLPDIDFLTTSQRLPQLRAFQFQPLLHHHPPQFPLMDIVQVTLIIRELEVWKGESWYVCWDVYHSVSKVRVGLAVKVCIILSLGEHSICHHSPASQPSSAHPDKYALQETPLVLHLVAFLTKCSFLCWSLDEFLSAAINCIFDSISCFSIPWSIEGVNSVHPKIIAPSHTKIPNSHTKMSWRRSHFQITSEIKRAPISTPLVIIIRPLMAQ